MVVVVVAVGVVAVRVVCVVVVEVAEVVVGTVVVVVVVVVVFVVVVVSVVVEVVVATGVVVTVVGVAVVVCAVLVEAGIEVVMVVAAVVVEPVVAMVEVVLDEQPVASVPASAATTKMEASVRREDFFATKDGDFMTYSPFQREVQAFPLCPRDFIRNPSAVTPNSIVRRSARRVGEYLLIKWYHVSTRPVKIKMFAGMSRLFTLTLCLASIRFLTVIRCFYGDILKKHIYRRCK